MVCYQLLTDVSSLIVELELISSGTDKLCLSNVVYLVSFFIVSVLF